MNNILTDIDVDLDVIFGEYRDVNAVQEFVSAARKAEFKGTLYIGYPVLAVDDERIEYDALLVSRDRGVIIFDLYSYDGINTNKDLAISEKISDKQEQLYAALYNKLNSFKELRRGRNLVVDLMTVSLHPISDGFVKEEESLLVGLNRLSELPQLESVDRLLNDSIEHLNAAIQRISNLRPKKKRDNVEQANSKGAIIKQIEKQIANLDLWQKRGSIEYVNGPQRIRGLAGSGKTVVLALKAAYLHVKRPDWNIVVTFNTRSLYQQFEALITRFVFAQINEEPDWSKLSIMHAWGGSDRDGVYSQATVKAGIPFLNFGAAARKFGYDGAFNGACQEALKLSETIDLQTYDMLLVDEAQDLPASFFQLAYRTLKHPKRIVWAYDDLQNLGDIRMPSASDLFGTDDKGKPLVVLENHEDQAQQDIVLPRCYRNPPWTLSAAHGLGFGVKRSQFAQIFSDLKIWKRLGYKSKRALAFDRDVEIERDPQSFPDFFDALMDRNSTLRVSTFANSQQQYQWITEEIKTLVSKDELQHSDILLVLPNVRTSKSAGAKIMRTFQAAGLQGHIPGQTSSRDAIFREGSIAITHIHRAKGNEAPVVFVVDAEFCEGRGGLKKRRNILFTAITRARGWAYISGVGEDMKQIEREFLAIKADDFALKFHYPSKAEAKKLAVSKDTALPEELSQDDIEDVRTALQKVKGAKWDQLPLDLREELKDLHGDH